MIKLKRHQITNIKKGTNVIMYVYIVWRKGLDWLLERPVCRAEMRLSTSLGCLKEFQLVYTVIIISRIEIQIKKSWVDHERDGSYTSMQVVTGSDPQETTA